MRPGPASRSIGCGRGDVRSPSATPAPATRPASVTATVWLTVAAALLDLVLAALLLVGPSATASADARSLQAATVVGWAEVALALVQVLLAVGLSRGSNAARLVLTLVLVARQVYAWVLVDGLGDGVGRGLLGLAASVVILALLWNPTATAFFERREERALGAMSAGRPEPAAMPVASRSTTWAVWSSSPSPSSSPRGSRRAAVSRSPSE